MKKISKSKGITLIALIITIIVLLIIAGVGISMLSNENGILNKSKLAKENYNSAQQNEQETLNKIDEIISGTSRSGSANSESNIITSVDFEITTTRMTSVVIQISSTASESNGVFGYHVFAVSKTDSTIIAHMTENLSYEINGLSRNTTYTIIVKAYDKNDNYKVSSSKDVTTTNGLYIYNVGDGDENWTVYRDSNTAFDLTSNNYMDVTSYNGNYCALNVYYKNPIDITGFSSVNCIIDANVYDATYGVSLSMNSTALQNLSTFNPYQYGSVLKTNQNDYLLKLDISNVADASYFIGFQIARTNLKIKAVWLE